MKMICKKCFKLILVSIQVFTQLITTVNTKSYLSRGNGSNDHHSRHLSYHHFYRSRSNSQRYRRSDELTVCDTCRMTLYDTPFYCPISPNLPQCIFPMCPKICDEVGGDPTLKLKSLPLAPEKPPPPPPPVNLPRIAMDLVNEFTPKSKVIPMERSLVLPTSSPDEIISPYNPTTCEFPSSNLRRIRPGSKYIEYRPSNPNHQVIDIHNIASKYGLALAEFRHPTEWYSVEKSSIMESVSTYKMTMDQPRRFYVVGLSDKRGEGEDPGKFLYKSDNTNPTFAVFDPRIYGRTDEQCGVLSHVLGSDKRQYLTTRFWNCDKYMADGVRVAHGLFMFPPGSLCHTKSEEECARLQQEDTGGDAVYHNAVQIGQTLKRFIYLYTDQRSWNDAFALCKAKGLQMLDFDTRWGDALRTSDVIEHFLKEARLNPVTTFWTAGRFEKTYSDGKFTWATTNTLFENQYKDEAPPFAFSFWDDQKVGEEDALSRRGIMKQPCVSTALNPEVGGERPKLNFKTWYCDFPMYVLCYKEINGTDTLDSPAPPAISGTRTLPDLSSCEKPPETNTKPKPGGGGGGEGEGGSVSPGDKEQIDPFNEKTCTSKSLTVRRLTPNSKYVDYQPKVTSYSVEQIKEQCTKYGLVPAEVRTREDWESIEKSGIGGIVAGDGGGTTDYFYVIGMDDSKEFGKILYATGGDKLTFSMFSGHAKNKKEDQCAMLDTVTGSGGASRGLMMLHVNCQEGLMSNEKIAYGLCMYPPTWKCFTESTEETAAASDQDKFTTIIPLGATAERSIFFNPVQRNREDALKFSKAANLSLLDFDSKWGDVSQVIAIVNDKIVKDGGFFQQTPFWTSGKLKGVYQDNIGTWETTGAPLEFPEGKYFHWVHRKYPHLSQIREGLMIDPCVETTFDNLKSVIGLRPDYCDIPKYFLMYRISKRRGDPPGINNLGITIIETGPRHVDASQMNPRRPVTLALVSSLTKSVGQIGEKEDKKREAIFDNSLSALDLTDDNSSNIINNSSLAYAEVSSSNSHNTSSSSSSSSSEEEYDYDDTENTTSVTSQKQIDDDIVVNKNMYQRISNVNINSITKTINSASESGSESTSSSGEDENKDYEKT